MSDPEQKFSLDEVRRQIILRHAAPYCIDNDAILSGPVLIERFKQIEEWLKTGAAPERPTDPKSKFSVIGGNNER